MKKYIIILGILLLPSLGHYLNAQYDNPDAVVSDEKENGKRKDNENQQPESERKSGLLSEESRVFFGGNVGLSFGTYTYIEIAPVIGYKFTKRFWGGLGPEYIYSREKNLDLEMSIYGLRTFASFAVLDNIDEVINLNIGSIFLYAENELLNMRPLEYDGTYYYLGNRGWYDMLLAGVGIRMPIGSRSGISIIVLWGLTESTEMLYSNPEIRLSIDI
jgi:hypothetical protein